MSADPELLSYLSFSSFPGVGPLRFKLLLSYFKSAEKAWNATSSELQSTGLPENLVTGLINFRKTFNAEKYVSELKNKDIDVITWNDKAYPHVLKEISDPPFVLYIKGNFYRDWGLERAIAVVGTRKVTTYGEIVTRRIVKDLVERGCLIVSGLAYGVDAIAHTAAIEKGGNTFAVLGCGVDIIHPVSNTNLYHQIINGKGVVISEFPVGKLASKGLFPARNRIVSGLSKAVVVTEGARSSGSLITARLALEQGKEVFAVPGPITSEYSEGPNLLIKEGATPIESGEDVLRGLGIEDYKRKINAADEHILLKLNLSKDEITVVKTIKNESLHIDSLIKKTRISASQIGSILTLLEMKKIIRKNEKGEIGLN